MEQSAISATDVTVAPKGQFEISPESKVLYLALREAAIGEVIPYAALSSAIKRDVQLEARHHLRSARERAVRHDAMVFDVIPNIGLKRLSADGIVDVVDGVRERVHRAAHRGLQRAACVDYDGLEEGTKSRFNVQRAQLGLIRAVTSERSTRKLIASEQSSQLFDAKVAMKKLKEFCGT